MARRPYTTACRFFKDSDQIVSIRWYPAQEPIECLPFPSKINSLDWSSCPWNAVGVGEVFGEPRTYNGAKVIPYAHGLVPCEPAEVFREGEVLDPDKPPQKYDELGFPLCCLNRFTATGGILWDGTALVDVITPFTPGNTCITAPHVGMPSVTIFDCNTGLDSWLMAPFSVPSFGSYTVHATYEVLSGPTAQNAILRRSITVNDTQSGACGSSVANSFAANTSTFVSGILAAGNWWAGLVVLAPGAACRVKITLWLT